MTDESWVVKFIPFASSVDSPFWVKYSQAKLETIQLNEEPIAITASYGVEDSPHLLCQESSLDAKGIFPNERVKVPVQLMGFNTIEAFQKVDKNNLLIDQFRKDFLQGNVERLISAVLLTFVDLKNHRVLYWFGIPALLPKSTSPIRCNLQTKLIDHWPQQQVTELSSRLQALRMAQLSSGLPPFFVTTQTDTRVLNASYLTELNVDENSAQDVLFGFFDPCGRTTASTDKNHQELAGWPMRNLVAYLSIHLNLGGKQVNILCYRPRKIRRIDAGSDNANDDDLDAGNSVVLRIVIPLKSDYDWNSDSSPDSLYKAVGWELNARNKPGPRWVNLRPLLDSAHLAIQAADLNLKLMKWRMLPNLDVDMLKSTKVCMIGAGTLGCNVARTLLGWGIRKIKIIDYGNVSYSNPVRQPLFTLEDCQGEDGNGRPKAAAAASHLNSIAADVESEGMMLSIPMPGHPEPPESIEKAVSTLDELIRESDVVFLLTDTRESRWLPTLMASVHDKMLINAALGLDSWLVMRHGGGIPPASEPSTRLGCYYCNDIVAPEDSTKNRTLDQQCTVTRPGLAPIASSMAVELMVALLHHPKKHFADAPQAGSANFSPSTSDSSAGALGVMPHQVRGSLVSYTMMTPKVPAFRYCTACSSEVIEAYKEDKMKLVQTVCESKGGSFLEDMSGLTAFREEAMQKLEEMEEDWDDEDDA